MALSTSDSKAPGGGAPCAPPPPVVVADGPLSRREVFASFRRKNSAATFASNDGSSPRAGGAGGGGPPVGKEEVVSGEPAYVLKDERGGRMGDDPAISPRAAHGGGFGRRLWGVGQRQQHGRPSREAPALAGFSRGATSNQWRPFEIQSKSQPKHTPIARSRVPLSVGLLVFRARPPACLCYVGDRAPTEVVPQ